MLVTRLADLMGTPREAHGEGWHSMQVLGAPEGAGLTVADTVLEAGFAADLPAFPGRQVRYCIEGEGVIGGRTIRPGTLVMSDGRDGLRLVVRRRMRLLSACLPPWEGGPAW